MAISIFDRPGSPTQHCIPMPNLQKTPPSKRSVWHRLGFPWLGKNNRRSPSRGSQSFRDPTSYNERSDASSQSANYNSNNLPRLVSSGVEVGLPRNTTFKRQNSEQRDRLYPTETGCRRTLSVDRRRPSSFHRTRSSPPVSTARLSAPEEAEDMLEKEMDKKWILNLSMHFRDRSEREKFFVTYAETPNKWLRVTVSCDYRNAEPDSLERDLKKLYYQRDKNARIYESIRDSLPEIQFYDTVTNLRLETREGRLHVHVTEDMNEIIPYPPISAVEYLGLDMVRESDLSFVAHLSGFAYQVKLNGKDYVKKEIPGPDMVNEFLYEINALYALIGSQSVIQLKAIVVDDDMLTTKGLLINFAEKGSLIELIYDYKGTIEWSRRAHWARQIIEGLAEIHEAGFVQGDLTVSNIVVDASDDAKIIDINRRGCPVGWEAPEFTKLLQSKQKISIGPKSVPDSEDVTFYEPCVDIGPQRLSCDFPEVNAQFAEFEIEENTLDFPTKEVDIELGNPSRAGLCSAIYSTLAFESSLDEIYTGVGQHLSCGIEYNLMMLDDRQQDTQSERCESLHLSILPINPALKDLSDPGQRDDVRFESKELSIKPTGKYVSESGRQDDLLFSSKLPINPAFKALHFELKQQDVHLFRSKAIQDAIKLCNWPL
ncbi:predicted protein [Histoplasma mississippiense (nom. inval.)]|uniref:predicted protein n=1 Tax=Ajellomyces capsulatus (strain NAm1 / WU24) TaxID=2059318 RepID=UPI000157CE95|nr:predicted protein [Histoplasma mississippiense (nom. inval.)]EDN10710.1 predicted protein [Histoplasma mississippiense (nom. inval.)]